MTIKLSAVELLDLRLTLRRLYGEKFDSDLNDDDINNIGNLLLYLYNSGLEQLGEEDSL